MIVNPTHVGMNRRGGGEVTPLARKPHTRGDEPKKPAKFASQFVVNPTHVGMNLSK